MTHTNHPSDIKTVLSQLETELKNTRGFFRSSKRDARFTQLKPSLDSYTKSEIIQGLSPIKNKRFKLIVKAIQRTNYLQGTCPSCKIGDTETIEESRLVRSVGSVGYPGWGGAASNQGPEEYSSTNYYHDLLVEKCSALCGYQREKKIGEHTESD